MNHLWIDFLMYAVGALVTHMFLRLEVKSDKEDYPRANLVVAIFWPIAMTLLFMVSFGLAAWEKVHNR